MSLTEQELRQQLEAAAAQALPPRFTVTDLAGRIRRRRASNAWAVSGGMAAVAAMAVAIPLGLANRTPQSVAPDVVGSQPLAIRDPQFTVTVNGQRPSVLSQPKPPAGCGRSPFDPCPAAPEPGFTVSPGERLSILAAVTIPARARITGLWLGISRGTFGSTRTGPIGLQPILAHITNGLQPGRRSFRLEWTVPGQMPHGTTLWLGASWSGLLPKAGPAGTQQPLISAAVTGPVTEFYISR
jgi:hypothetical protein